ncbi:MAG: hypothetical protein ABI239_01120 [Aquihabitans sp.]
MNRALRRLGATLATVVVLGGSLAAPVAASPIQTVQQPPVVRGQSEPIPALRLVAQTREVSPDGDFSVLVSIAGAPENSDLAVDIYGRITTDAELRQSATLEPANERDRFDPLPITATGNGPVVTGFSIQLHDDGPPRAGSGAWAYRLTEPGVYPIRLRLRDHDGDVLTSVVTYLVRTADGDDMPATPTSVAILTPVQAPVSRLLDVDEPVSDDHREAFDAVLDAFAIHPELPATFAITPDTAARLDADPAAQGTIDALSAAVANPQRELLGAPYVPVDPAALVDSGLTDELRRQIDLGRRTLTDTVSRSGTATWWIDQPIDGATIDQLHDAGVDQLVVAPAVLDGNRPSRPLLLTGTTQADTLTVAATGPVAVPDGPVDDPVLVVHQILSRLAATTGPTAVMVIDPTTVDPAVLSLLLDEIGRPHSYLAPSTISQVFDIDADAAATPASPPPPDLGSYPDQVRTTRTLAANYGSMLSDPSQLDDELDRRLALAAADEATPEARTHLFNDVDGELRSRFSVVTMPASERVTLGARDATFPLNIRSEASETLKVVITLRSSDRLGLPQDRIETTLQPGRNIVSVPVQTRTSGDTPLFITVSTPDGHIVLADSRYTIRSTAVSGVGLLLTIGAASFLVIWWARHWRRNAKERKEATAIALALDDEELFVDDDHSIEPTTSTSDVTDPVKPGSDPD